MAVNGIEIEVGQTWKTRGGAGALVVGKASDGGQYPWQVEVGGGVEWVGADGLIVSPRQPHHHDFLELVEVPVQRPTCKLEIGDEVTLKNGRVLTVSVLHGGHSDAPYQGTTKAYPKHHCPFWIEDVVSFRKAPPAPSIAGMEVVHVDPAPAPSTSAPDVLDAAAKHMRDRAATYDKPEGERSMLQTVKVFNAFHGTELTEAQGWHFMQVLKDVRMFTRDGYHADSGEDGVAYAALKCEAKAQEVSA